MERVRANAAAIGQQEYPAAGEDASVYGATCYGSSGVDIDLEVILYKRLPAI